MGNYTITLKTLSSFWNCFLKTILLTLFYTSHIASSSLNLSSDLPKTAAFALSDADHIS